MMKNTMTPEHERQGREPDDTRTVLRSAVEEGYFGVPREISLAELSEKHDLSTKEASERLRYGVDKLVRDELLGN
jgi:predicted DNA binding protein